MARNPKQKGAAAPATAQTATPATAHAAPAVQAKPAPPALPWAGVQHGVTPPKRAGLCSAVWELTSNGMQAGANGQPPTLPPLAPVKAAAVAQGLNPTNVSIEYYRCRTWHGVRGRQAQAPAPAAQ